jgi:hypothetical protein
MVNRACKMSEALSVSFRQASSILANSAYFFDFGAGMVFTNVDHEP